MSSRRCPHRRYKEVMGRSFFGIIITSISHLILCWMVFHRAAAAAAAVMLDNNNQQHSNTYTIIGVSGGLQKGFPDHSKLNYYSPHYEHEDNGIVKKAVFLGRALVRGYKAYLDVMESTHRQYISSSSSNEHDDDAQEQQPLINSNVIPTGCWHHANEYWMYLVDTRQALSILMNEPRFLSITPDHGLVDLTADETSPVIKHIAQHEITHQNKTDYSSIAFPIVTCVWYNPTSHVPSPVLYTKLAEEGDGSGTTEVTNFPQSLLKWIGLDPQVGNTYGAACQPDVEAYIDSDISTPLEIKHFWTNVTKSIRQAEATRRRPILAVGNGDDDPNAPWTLAAACTKKAPFGTSRQQARINYSFNPHEFQRLLQKGGYDIDYDKAKVLFSNASSAASTSSSSSS